MQWNKGYESLTNSRCWERINVHSGGLLEWAMLEVCTEDSGLATVQPFDKCPMAVPPAVTSVITPRQAFVRPKAWPKRQRLDHEEAVAIYLAKLGPKSSKTAACVAAEFGITAKAVRDVWRGKTWADQTRCVWTVQKTIFRRRRRLRGQQRV